jgi:DNA-binding NtrC family response regulator
MSVSISRAAVVNEDEAMARRYGLALLISGHSTEEVETVARRIHRAQFGPAAPFVAVDARLFPSQASRLRRYLASQIAAAIGGSLFIADVEELRIRAQDAFVEVLRGQLLAPTPAVRLITGTTVSLRERIAAGCFTEELFYRLNVIHLVVEHEADRTLRLA